MQSDRKLTLDQYIFARIDYLRTERVFWRQTGIIVDRPDDYDQNGDSHEEVWTDNELQKVNGSNVCNVDEVPFNIDFQSGNIIMRGERSNINCTQLRHISKYRKGTFVIVMNCGKVLLIMVIFMVSSGGEEIRARMNEWAGNLGAKIIWAVAEKGSMNGRTWIILLRALANISKKLRGCTNLDGRDWTRALLLYADNYGVHLNDVVAQAFAANYGIFIRCLIRNASHIQQPVDQNVGQLIKVWLVVMIEEWVCELERLHNCGSDYVVDKQTWREYVVGFVSRCIVRINSDEFKHVILSSWINFGLHLPLDGSLDGDRSTLQVQHLDKKRNEREHRRKYKKIWKIVNIPRRRRGAFTVTRRINLDAIHQIAERYTLRKSEENGVDASTQNSFKLVMIRLDLAEKYKKKLQNIEIQAQQDFSRIRTQYPRLKNLISAQELASVEFIYAKYPYIGIHNGEWLYTQRIGIPYRDLDGLIIKPANLRGIHIIYMNYIIFVFGSNFYVFFVVNNDNDDAAPFEEEYIPMFRARISPYSCNQTSSHRTPLVKTVLEFLHLEALITEIRYAQNNWNQAQVRQVLIEEALQEAAMWDYFENLNSNQMVRTLSCWTHFIVGMDVSTRFTILFNWAKDNAGEVGVSSVTYCRWYESFVENLEICTGFDQIEIDDDWRNTGKHMWDFINILVDDGNASNALIMSNNNKRSWFLSWIYIWSAQEELLQLLQTNTNGYDGDNLLSKILELVRYGTIESNKGILSMLLQYIEALLIGHHCYWEFSADLYLGLDILTRVSSTLLSSSMVEYNLWCRCESGHLFSEQKIRSQLLYLNFKSAWNRENGFFVQTTDYVWNCENLDCESHSEYRIYGIENDQSDFFGIYFREGVPVELWNDIMRGLAVQIGSHLRMVWKGIFEIENSKFIASFLCAPDSGDNNRIWWGLDTINERLSDHHSLCRRHCRILIFQAPEKCNICSNYWQKLEFMQYCTFCGELVHKDCASSFTRPGCDSVACKRRRRRRLLRHRNSRNRRHR